MRMNLIKAHGEKGSGPFSFERWATSPPQADHVLVDLFFIHGGLGGCVKAPQQLTEHVNSDLRSFMLEISYWMMLHGWVDQLKLIDRDQIKMLIENNQSYTKWEITNILKISKLIKLLVKMKNMSFILWKKLNGLFGQPNIT